MYCSTMRVLGRVRLSRLTDETTSPERQRALIEANAAAGGHTIVGWAVDLEVSRSVNPFEAPELGPWLTDPELIDQWDVLIAWKIDRVAVGSIYLSKMIEFCQKHKKNLVSTSETFDLSTWQGRMFAQMIAGVAEGEWELIRDRNRGAAKELRETGRWGGGKANYWLRPVRRGKGWWLEPDPYTAPVTRRIIARFLEHAPVETIAAELSVSPDGPDTSELAPYDYLRHRRMRAIEAEGGEYPGKPVAGGPWSIAGVRNILKSPMLLGYQEHDGQLTRDANGDPVAIADPLISQSEADRIKAEFSRRAQTGFERERGAGKLLGIAVCGECQKPAYLNNQRHRRGAKVYEYARYRFECKHNPAAPAEDLEREVHYAILDGIGGIERFERRYVAAEDHTEELRRASEAISDLTAQLATAKSRAQKQALSDALAVQDARAAELEKLPTVEAGVEYVPSGETYVEAWQRMDDGERRRLLLDSGITVAVAVVGPQGAREYELAVWVPLDLRQRLHLPDSWRSGGGRAAKMRDLEAARARGASTL